jgi:hypothetical protein
LANSEKKSKLGKIFGGKESHLVDLGVEPMVKKEKVVRTKRNNTFQDKDTGQRERESREPIM